jgi:hypothetical protein
MRDLCFEFFGPLIHQTIAFVLFRRLNVATDHRDWPEAKQLLERTGSGDDAGQFTYRG